VADGASPRLRRIEDYPALLNEAWAQAHAPREANAPTVISTFAGCGGSSLGYHMAGFRELLAVEWEQNAADTFRLNFPHVPLYHGDIAKLSVEECLRLANVKPGELDVFDGSPPCQGFSTAGKREIGDARNQLFREYCRLLEGLRPRAFVMENVSGMVKGNFKLVFAEILRTLKRCGYRVKARLLNAMFYGVPQSRERMIFIGVREDIGREPSHPAGWSDPVVLRRAIADIADDGPAATRSKGTALQRMPAGTNNGGGKYLPHSFGLTRASWDVVCPTLVKEPKRMAHPSGQRFFSVAAAKRVGSFPDPFQMVGKYELQWNRIGNSVPPLLMRSIASHIRTLIGH
jgi:DNA (cytosine-5)-methyltransferase 1